MQEEIEEKTVRFANTTTKLSVRTIIAGVKAYLRHRQKKQLAAIDEHIQGKQSILLHELSEEWKGFHDRG